MAAHSWSRSSAAEHASTRRNPHSARPWSGTCRLCARWESNPDLEPHSVSRMPSQRGNRWGDGSPVGFCHGHADRSRDGKAGKCWNHGSIGRETEQADSWRSEMAVGQGFRRASRCCDGLLSRTAHGSQNRQAAGFSDRCSVGLRERYAGHYSNRIRNGKADASANDNQGEGWRPELTGTDTGNPVTWGRGVGNQPRSNLRPEQRSRQGKMTILTAIQSPT